MNIVSKFEFIVAQKSNKPALIHGERVISFRQLKAQALGVSLQLTAQGLLPRDRCIVSTTNSVDTASVILGCWYAGAIPVLVNELSPIEHINHATVVTDPKLIILNNPTQKSIESSKKDVPVHTLSSMILSAQKMRLNNNPENSVIHNATCAHDIASIVFTSGSSGMPKGVAQTHQSLTSSCISLVSHLGLNEEDIVFCPVPWSFDYGYGQLLSTFVCGMTQSIPEKSDMFSICDAIDNSSPTVFAGLPSVMGGLCKGLNPIKNVNTSSIRLVTNTGSKLHSDLMSVVQDAFPNAEISLNYGLTETYRSASLPTHFISTHSDSVGFAVPGVELLVVTPDNSVAKPGEIGEIVHRGLGTFSGYWGDIDRTDAVLKPDPYWSDAPVPTLKSVFTGDIGWKDEQGFLYIKGRRDRQIKIMGVRVSPDEIESIVRQYHLINDAAVTTQSHELFGSLIKVSYTVIEDMKFELNGLKKYCKENMSPYMLPREFHEFRTLPRTSSGKTDYVLLTKLVDNKKNF